MALTVNPTAFLISSQATAGAMSGVVLQLGTVVNAQVVAAAENLVQIAIAGLTIDVLSEIPLSPGQNLKLAVSQPDSNTIRLALVGQGTAGAGVTVEASSQAPSPQVAAPVTSPVISPAPSPQVAAPVTSPVISPAPSPQVAAPVTSPAIWPAPSDPLTPLERIAVSVASESAAAQQQSLGPLFANLNTVAATPSLPPALQQAIVQVLAQQTRLDPNLTGANVQSAFQKSGLFLEAFFAAAPAPSASVPDLKAALIVLRQTLVALLATPEMPAAAAVAAPSPGEARSRPVVQTTTSPMLAPSQSVEIDAHEVRLPQAHTAPANETALARTSTPLLSEVLLGAGPKLVTSGAALEPRQEALQDIPRVAGNGSIATSALQDGRSVDAIIRTSTPPPPFRGALPSAQPAVASSIAPNAPVATMVRRLLDDTEAALARQTLLQVASLPDRADHAGSRVDPVPPRWNFEIPFATPQGSAIAQFEISRDGGGSEVDPARRVWRARFSLDIEPAGPVHALIAYSGERTSVRMWAERPQTAAQLRAGAAELSQALRKAELSPGDIVIGEGTPPIERPARAGHFLDRAL
jgi:Flagellar hook-length control protein FliK